MTFPLKKISFSIKSDNYLYKIDYELCKVNAFKSINLEPMSTCVALSICGSYIDGNGQIQTLLREEFSNDSNILEFLDPWDRLNLNSFMPGTNLQEEFPNNSNILKFLDLWDRWHLNSFRPGTNLQEDFIRLYKKENPNWKYDYVKACELLKAANLLEDRGYKYGHEWLVEEIPDSVLSEIEYLIEAIKSDYAECNKE